MTIKIKLYRDERELTIFPEPARVTAKEEYGVVTHKLSSGGKSRNTVTINIIELTSKERIMRVTCTCQHAVLRTGPRMPCYHVRAVIKYRMPGASFWPDLESAKRQHRKIFKAIYAADELRRSNTGGIFYITDRYRNTRREIK